jgi:ectoine utilization protein EutC
MAEIKLFANRAYRPPASCPPRRPGASRVCCSGMKRELLLLRETEIRQLLDPAACIAAVERAFTAYATGQAELPAVINLDVPERRGEVHVKSGHLRGGTHFAVKVACGFPENAALGLPTGNGLVLTFDAATGIPSALLLDNGYITDLRTGAAGAVAAKHLARSGAHRIGIVGAGVQARFQTRMLALVRTFDQVRVWGRDRERAQSCVHELSQDFSMPRGCKFSAAESVGEVVEGADIVITVTASREPLVRSEWIAPGALVIAVGSDGPDKQELDVDVLARADYIVADSLAQCLRLGEIHHAVERGAIAADKVSAELGEITAGEKPGRQSDEAVIVCDLTGVGVQDVAAASLVLERARAAGAGQSLAL